MHFRFDLPRDLFARSVLKSLRRSSRLSSLGLVDGVAFLGDVHHRPEDMATVAKFSNGFYGKQAVTLVHDKKGSRYIFRPCKDRYFAAQPLLVVETCMPR